MALCSFETWLEVEVSHPNEYTEELHYYPFAMNLDRCMGSCNTLSYQSNKVCVPNKTEDVNLSVLI